MILLLISSFTEAAAEQHGFRFGSPYVTRIDFPEKDPGSIPWNVAWDEDGVAWVGRDRLWRWDGSHWSVHGPDDLKFLRGLFFDDTGSLWMGGYNSLGCFDPTTLEYTSVLDWIPEEYRTFGDVWNVYHDGSHLWVGTNFRLFKVSADSFQVWEFGPDHRIIFHFLSCGIFAHEVNQGIWKISEEKQLITGNPRIAERSVMYLSCREDGSYSSISGVGYFELEDAKITNTRDLPKLYYNSISSACANSENDVLIGTLGHGLYEFNNDGYELIRLDTEGLLDDKLIINLLIDSDEMLWVIETEGIWVVDINSLGLKRLLADKDNNGNVEIAKYFSDSLLIGTSQGVLKHDLEEGNVITNNYIVNSECLQLINEEGEWFTTQYNRIIEIGKNSLKSILSFDRRITTFEILKSEIWVVSFPDRINGYRLRDGGTADPIFEQLVSNEIQKLEKDAHDRVWGWSPKTSLHEIFLNSDGEVGFRSHEEVGGIRLSDHENKISITDAGPVVVFRDKIFERSDATGVWRKGTLATDMGIPVAQAFQRDATSLSGWLIYRDDEAGFYQMVSFDWPDEGEASWAIVPWIDMSELGRIHSLRVEADPDPILIIIGYNGVLMTTPDLSAGIGPPKKPVIWDTENKSVTAGITEFPFAKESPRYRFSSPGGNLLYPVRYQTRIKGASDSWSVPARYTDREIGQLMEGHYQFQVRAVDPFGRTSPVASASIRIIPPWYRTPFAYLLCIATLITVVYGAVRYREHQLRTRQIELESLVEERTDALKRANAFKDEFIANLSHEIRNPLNGVIGLIRQLHDDQAPTKRNIVALRGAAHYLQATVEDVLDFSKLESGTISINETCFDLAELVSGVTHIYRDQAQSKGIQLTSKLDIPEGWLVQSDERKLQQILGNLTSNAVKFTDHGMIEIQVVLIPESATTGKLSFRISDSGRGIEAEEQDKVFEKFFQGGKGIQKASGTGLGLTLVKTFIESLDGELLMESKPGRGTTFEVVVPVKVVEASESGISMDDLVSHLDQRVLIVEDLEYNRLYLETFLTGIGCQVDFAKDGPSGLEQALHGEYDSILLDWDLPGMSGLEVAKAIRANPAIPASLQIIGMTAFATLEIRQQCLNAGMNGFLTKPLDIDLLAKMLESSVSEKMKLEKGILGEMVSGDEWETHKDRWKSFFEEYLQTLKESLNGEDCEEIRKQAHKLLGHLRMIKVEGPPEVLIDLMTAAQSGDTQGARLEWERFKSMLKAFRKAFDSL